MEKAFAKLFHFLFVHFLARRAAGKLRSHLPLLGMENDQVMVVASPGKRAGQIYLQGFGTPKLSFGYFLRTAKGYEALNLTVFVNARNRLELETPDGMEPLSFRDPRALPVVEFLKTICFFWSYTLYMTASLAQVRAREPQWKG